MKYTIINIVVIIIGIIVAYFVSFVLLKKCDNKSPIEEIRYADSIQSRNYTIKKQIEILKQNRDNEIVKVNNLEVTKEDYDNRLEEFATRSGKTVDEFDKEISDYERSYITNDILMTKLMNLLKSKNIIK